MTVFTLKSNVISGHEKMFMKFYDHYEGEKKIIDINKEKLWHILTTILSSRKLIISTGYPLQNLWLIFILRLFGKRLNIYTPFGFRLHDFRIKHADLKEWIYKFCLTASNISFTTCSLEQAEYLKKRFPGQSVFPLNNFIEPVKEYSVDAKDDFCRVFFIGRVDQVQKNCLFFKQLTDLIDYPIHLIGPIANQEIKDQLFGSNLTLHGVMRDPYENISERDCIVLPSFYEGAALVVIEACFRNIPIILLNSVGNSRIAEAPLLFNSTQEACALINSCFNRDASFQLQWKNFRNNICNAYTVESFLIQLQGFQNYFSAI